MAEKKQQRVSKVHKGKRRASKRRRQRHAARARRHGTVYGYRYERRAMRAQHRRHVHEGRRHRFCGKVYGYRRTVRRAARSYVVRRGDTLSGIARRYYGHGTRYRRIYQANRHKIRNANLIYPRQRIYIP
jgi:nucleoid-associated protein YgaU